MRSRYTLEQRFWAKVQKTEFCWLWIGSKDSHGRGRININYKPTVASRVAWELTVGPISDGLSVLHRCDNPSCVNPKHLFLGSQLDNQLDSVNKGRHARGETSGRAKLTVEEVNEIRQLVTSGITQKKVAVRFNISQGHVSNIINQNYWVQED